MGLAAASLEACGASPQRFGRAVTGGCVPVPCGGEPPPSQLGPRGGGCQTRLSARIRVVPLGVSSRAAAEGGGEVGRAAAPGRSAGAPAQRRAADTRCEPPPSQQGKGRKGGRGLHTERENSLTINNKRNSAKRKTHNADTSFPALGAGPWQLREGTGKSRTGYAGRRERN